MGTIFSLKNKKKKITLKGVDKNADLTFDKNYYIERKRNKKPRPPNGPPPPKPKVILDVKKDDSDEFFEYDYSPPKEIPSSSKIKINKKKKKIVIKPIRAHDDDEHEYIYDDELKEYDEDILEFDLEEFTNTDNIKLL